MVEPNQGKVLDVDGIEEHSLLANGVRLIKPYLPHLDQRLLRQTCTML